MGESSVCVIGAEMVRALFPLDSPIGKHVRVGGDYYEVIGVMEPTGKGVQTDETQEDTRAAADRMFIPLETAKTRYGEILRKVRSGSFEQERVQLHEVTVKVSTPEAVPAVADAIKEVMERNRSEEHTSELQSRGHLVCRLLLEKKKKTTNGSPSPLLEAL